MKMQRYFIGGLNGSNPKFYTGGYDLFLWEGKRIAMIPSEEQVHVPTAEFKNEENILKVDVVDDHIGNGYSLKDKIKGKNDKTEHEMERV
ncbi:hypothetical protein Tco_0516155 [Tanacetum coccineum]